MARRWSACTHVPDSRKAMIPGTSHWMFEQAPQQFCEIVLEFLAA
jgi:esterase